MIKRRKRRQKMRTLMMSLCRAIDATSVQNVHNGPDRTSFEIIPRVSIVLVTQLIVRDRWVKSIRNYRFDQREYQLPTVLAPQRQRRLLFVQSLTNTLTKKKKRLWRAPGVKWLSLQPQNIIIECKMPAVDICVAHVYNQIHVFFLLDYLDLFSHNTTVSQKITKRQIWLFLGTFRKPNTRN